MNPKTTDSVLSLRRRSSAPSLSSSNKAKLYYDGTSLKVSKSGGAFGTILTGTETLSSAVVWTNSRTTGDIVTIAGGSVTPTGSLVGLKIDMSGVVANGQYVQGLEVIGNKSTIAKATGQGLMMVKSRFLAGRTLGILVRNKTALAGSLVSVGWDATNYEDATASSILTGVTHMFTLDGQTNVNASTNNVAFVGARILVPRTTSASTAGLKIETQQLDGAGIHVVMFPATVSSAAGVFVEDTTGGEPGTLLKATSTAYLPPLIFTGAWSGPWSAGGSASDDVRYNFNQSVAITTQNVASWDGSLAYFQNDLTHNIAGDTTLAINVVRISHTTTHAAGTFTDTSVGLLVEMAPATSQLVTGIHVSLSANVADSGIKITHAGSGSHLKFASAADGNTVGHIQGPDSGSLSIIAGIASGTANGREVIIRGTEASNDGTGGSIYIIAGNAAGGDNRGGDIVLGAGERSADGTYSGILISPDNPTYIELYEMTDEDPETPAAGAVRLFVKPVGAGAGLVAKTSDGTVHNIAPLA